MSRMVLISALRQFICLHCWLLEVWNFLRCPKSFIYFPSSLPVVIYVLIHWPIKHMSLWWTEHVVHALRIFWFSELEQICKQDSRTSWCVGGAFPGPLEAGMGSRSDSDTDQLVLIWCRLFLDLRSYPSYRKQMLLSLFQLCGILLGFLVYHFCPLEVPLCLWRHATLCETWKEVSSTTTTSIIFVL